MTRQHAPPPPVSLGNALKAGWDSSADDVAKALKGAGYNVDEVGNYLSGIDWTGW